MLLIILYFGYIQITYETATTTANTTTDATYISPTTTDVSIFYRLLKKGDYQFDLYVCDIVEINKMIDRDY